MLASPPHIVITAKTRVFAVVGSPVAHSLSPALFNFLFASLAVDAVYLAFSHPKIEPLIAAMRTLPICGFSITLPHKKNALLCMDTLDPAAQALAAINTAFLEPSGDIKGYNFDGIGALAALSTKSPAWRDHDVMIIGDGGSATGIALSIAQDPAFTQTLFIASRKSSSGELLSQRITQTKTAAQWFPLENLQQHPPQQVRVALPNIRTLIQTTPLGMKQEKNNQLNPLPLDLENFSPKTLVYDIIYTPMMTPFLKRADMLHLPTLSGLQMFLEQAFLQFHLFTGLSPSLEVRAQACAYLKNILSSQSVKTSG